MSIRISCSRCLVSPPISQALPGDLFEGYIRALHIGIAKLLAGVVAKVKLGHIAMKMLLANMMERSDKTALEDRKVTLNRIRRHIPARVFTCSVVATFMLGETLIQRAINGMLIGVHGCSALDVLAQHVSHSAARNCGNRKVRAFPPRSTKETIFIWWWPPAPFLPKNPLGFLLPQ